MINYTRDEKGNFGEVFCNIHGQRNNFRKHWTKLWDELQILRERVKKLKQEKDRKKIKFKRVDPQKELWKCYESMTRKELIETCKEQHLEMIKMMKRK